MIEDTGLCWVWLARQAEDKGVRNELDEGIWKKIEDSFRTFYGLTAKKSLNELNNNHKNGLCVFSIFLNISNANSFKAGYFSTFTFEIL